MSVLHNNSKNHLFVENPGISKPQIEGWLKTGSLLHFLPIPDHLAKQMDNRNERSSLRIDAHDGWWETASDPVIESRRQHSIRRGRQWVVNYLSSRLKPKAFILDWGGGTGWFSHLLKLARPDIITVSVDLCDVMQTWGNQAYKETILYICADCTDIKVFKSKTFDAIIGCEVVEHFPNYNQALTAAKSWLVDGGCLILDTPNPLCYASGTPDDYLVFRVFKKLKRALKGNPLTKVKKSKEIEEKLYDKAIHPDDLKKAVLGAGFSDVNMYFTQWLAEYPISMLHRLTGRFITSLVVKVLESIEERATQTIMARKLGFTQILIANVV